MKVLTTRPEDSQEQTIKAFEEAGFEVHNLPMVQTLKTHQLASLKRPERLIEDIDCVILSSPRGARFFVELYKRDDFVGRTVAAVGPSTAKVLKEAGFEPIVPHRYDQEGLIDLLVHRPALIRVLYFGALEKRRDLIEELETLGRKVIDFPAYRTVCTRLKEEDVLHWVVWSEVMVFFSPSAVRCLTKALGGSRNLLKLVDGRRIVAIGHVTAKALKKQGVMKVVYPARHDLTGVVELLKELANGA